MCSIRKRRCIAIWAFVRVRYEWYIIICWFRHPRHVHASLEEVINTLRFVRKRGCAATEIITAHTRKSTHLRLLHTNCNPQ
jgi:hypothetical protein